jgi:DNA repair protein RadC
MDAFAIQPDARPRPAAPPAAAALGAADAEEREILFGLLEPCLGCMEAAEAVEALLARFGDLAGVFAAAPRDLAALPELGEAGAAALRAVLAAAQRLDRLRQARRTVLPHAEAWVAHLRRRGAGVPAGQFRALFLDPDGVLLAEESVAAAPQAVPGQVLRRALALEAEGIVLARGCAGARAVADARDVAMARSLDQVAEVMGLRLRDLLVMGRVGHASVRGAGAR